MQEAPTGRASNPSIEEHLEFERLLFELSVRFADISADQVVAAIESALLQLVRFLDFDRSAFWEFIDEEQQHFLCSVAVEGVEPPQRGPIPADLAWSAKELRAGRTSLSFDQTKISRPEQRPLRNIIAALVSAPFLLSRCALMAE